MRAWAFLLLPVLWSCAHAQRESVVASMTTLGPRLLIVVAEEPLVASGAADLLCIGCPDAWAARPAAEACVPPGGAPVELHASIATEEPGLPCAELPVVSERRVGEAHYLCFGPVAPLPAGASYTRATVRASASVRVPQILWIGAPR